MKIAVEGCCHDELEVIYDSLEHIQKIKGVTIDLLLVCGDFQATRNPDDLLCMAVPIKYRNMKYFYKYYKGEKVAPMLTIIIGGNHEASNHMQELPYGGWLAPKIYYLGYAGIVNVGGVRIGGMSGIYNGKDYHKGHFEKPPYNNETLRTCYHTRSLEVFRLKQVSQPVDIMLSHDWPLHAVHAGNFEALMKWKPHFKDEILQNSLGSPAAQEVLTHIKPKYWFSAHLHCKYPALIKHQSQGDGECKTTRFLSLDKCLPRRNFLQVIDIPSTKEGPYRLELDPEWLVILTNTNHLLNTTKTPRYMPGVGCKERYDFKVTPKEIQKLLADFGGDMTLPENFEKTVTPYDGFSDKKKGKAPTCQVNPQTTLLSQMLGITDPFAVFCGKSVERNPDEINLDIDSESEETTTQDNSESEETTTQDNSEAEETDTAPDTTLDTTSSDKFPTFIHSLSSADENIFNDSNVSESSQIKFSSTPVRMASTPGDNKNVGPDHSIAPSPLVSRMSLPQPKMDSLSESISCESGESLELAVNRKRSSTSDDTSPPPTQEISSENVVSGCPSTIASTPESSTTSKKFKRRNVAMYSILSNQAATEEETSDPS